MPFRGGILDRIKASIRLRFRDESLTAKRDFKRRSNMKPSRRGFLKLAAGSSALALVSQSSLASEPRRPSLEELDRAAAEPVLKLESLSSPVKIASMELLRNGREFLVRVRSTDGAEGLAVPNSDRLIDTYPIFVN